MFFFNLFISLFLFPLFSFLFGGDFSTSLSYTPRYRSEPVAFQHEPQSSLSAVLTDDDDEDGSEARSERCSCVHDDFLNDCPMYNSTTCSHTHDDFAASCPALDMSHDTFLSDCPTKDLKHDDFPCPNVGSSAPCGHEAFLRRYFGDVEPKYWPFVMDILAFGGKVPVFRPVLPDPTLPYKEEWRITGKKLTYHQTLVEPAKVFDLGTLGVSYSNLSVVYFKDAVKKVPREDPSVSTSR